MIKLPEINANESKDKIIRFIKKKKMESNSDGIVIGLSGGLDSTIVAYLSKEAIGKENIFGFHFYNSTSSKEDTEHARLVVKSLNIKYREIAIDKLLEEFYEIVESTEKKNKEKINTTNVVNVTAKINDEKEIFKESDEHIQRLANGNLKSRIRMSLLYYYANLKNCIVAGTGNKSELLIGYFTKYGDGASDFLPIADIYKTQLKKLAIEWNLPEKIVNKPPSAGLWPGQSDEKEIGISYDILDKLLYSIVDKKLNDDNILKEMEISASEIESIRNKINNNKHKIHFPSSPFEDEKLF